MSMNILIIWYGIPTYWNGSTSRLFYLLRWSKKYNNKITLITFKKNVENEDDLKKYGDIITIDLPSKIRIIRDTIWNNILYLKNIHLPITPFSLEIRKKIEEVVGIGDFDLIYINHRMFLNALKLKVNAPKVLDIPDPLVYSHYQYYLQERTITGKIKWLLYYYNYRYFEVSRYKNFDAYIFVSPEHKKLMDSYIPAPKNVFYIPQGVDIENFKPMYIEEEPHSLIFTGSMNYPPNVNAILYFCKKIYPLIKHQKPEVKLYVVGQNPSKEILKLRSKDIIITGFVDNIKPYMAKAAVAIVPIVTDDGGFKIKVLEAMAMGKPLVSTSLGSKGINITNGENIIIADNPEDFAKHVIELLNDKQMRERIGTNARRFVVNNYSWEKMTNMLNNAFKEIVGKHG